MPQQRKNYAGQKYNLLTLIRPTNQIKSKSVVWECLCDCGNTCFKLGTKVANGKVKSCGCIKQSIFRQCKAEGCITTSKTTKINNGYCNLHYQRIKRNKSITLTRRERGTGSIDDNGYVVIQINGKTYKEHRLIIEQHIGRKLLPTENIHHLNGNRSDNRIENLEIWNISQPPGQRIEDKIKWAKEILAHYNPDQYYLIGEIPK